VPYFILLMLYFFGIPSSYAGSTTVDLDGLLEQVYQEGVQEQQENEQRTQVFLQERDQQKQKLAEAKQRLAELKAQIKITQENYDKDKVQLAEQQQKLDSDGGALRDLSTQFKQLAQATYSTLSDSFVSAQYPAQLDKLSQLSHSDYYPTEDDLKSLWQIIMTEMVESGKVSQFQAQVITPQGEEVEQSVVRIGTFNAITEGQFLRYLADTNKLIVLARQPSFRYQHLAQKLQQNADKQGLATMALDPSRGRLLALLVQSPSLEERIHQGGIIGYIILAIGALGLLIVLERFIVLTWLQTTINRQLKAWKNPTENNPLGRILKVCRPEYDTEVLGLKLDEAILKEIPKIKAGLATLGIFIAMAPLLGLLGTVTGMIETFQAMTLFGTGDAKLMSGGISEALITTALGLVIAIPLMLLHSFLSGKSNRLIHILDEQSAALVANHAQSYRLG